MKNEVDLEESFEKSIELYAQWQSRKEEMETLEFSMEDLEEEIAQPLISKEKHLKDTCGGDPAMRQTNYHSYPKKERIKSLVWLFGAILAGILAVVFLIAGISNSKKANIFNELKHAPGQGYQQWTRTWEDYSKFEDLSETWYLVEEDWKKAGVSVSWAEVLEIKNAYFSYGTIYSDTLLSKICFEMSGKHTNGAGTCYSFMVGLGIVTVVALFIFFKVANPIYSFALQEYKEELKRNAELQQKHTEWTRNIRIQEQKYLQMQKAHEKKKAELLTKKEEYEKSKEKCAEKLEELRQERLEAEEPLRQKLYKADEKIPDNKKPEGLGVGFYSPPFSADFWKEIRLYLQDGDFKQALLKYYEKEIVLHAEREAEKMREEELRAERRREKMAELQMEEERERSRLEKERNRLEKERNQIERERIRAYERQEEANRLQQEKLAKKEAELAQARAHCASCALYHTCRSSAKNKQTLCFGYKTK